MKKLVSIILTAAMCAAMAVPVAAEEKITADEVKEWLFSKGVCAYPVLCDSIAINFDDDVLHPTAKLSDVIDINRSICADHEFKVNEDLSWTLEARDHNIPFFGIGKDAFGTGNNEWIADVMVNYAESGDTYFSLEDDSGKHKNTICLSGFNNGIEDAETYKMLAESINEYTEGEVEDIEWASMHGIPVYPDSSRPGGYIFGEIGAVLYVKTSAAEYAILFNDKDYMGLQAGTTMTVDELIPLIKDYYYKQLQTTQPVYAGEHIVGDEIRDTDTRAAYIGTDSMYDDVSGELVSYVNELSDLGIINGYGNGTFRPELAVSRAEASAMIARMLGYNESYDSRFSDIAEDAWYKNAVSALAINGIISGTGDDKFTPDAPIIYADMFKILECVIGYAEDFRNTRDYRSTAMGKAITLGLTDGLGSFTTEDYVTRGDMAIILSNALDTHMYTTNIDQIFGDNAISYTGAEDITLIDYINGRRLNGELNADY
ncbi:MAG: S-layer homology domain-containing protein [Oscillospiraceae bacterium]|nr:S-layer homology domain-containing protein [Oscillospiraceae bacterium]